MILRDPVHGLVSFESEEDAIIERLLETRELQRLRRIRQLGLTSLAFPGAEHTRFAHALGAAFVMQRTIARLRQIDSDLPFWQRLTSERARDALAAALLHDVGHGPLSHLFEHALPNAPRHETWTVKVVSDPSSDVHRVLSAEDPGMPARVAELVVGRHELTYLGSAVSGTFDVDRCDYLLRDAHFTGVTYGRYDLDWLLRSLRFEQTPDQAEAPRLAIDGIKGITAIESFLLARLFMFQQVYFHKSTRAAECMVTAILRRAVELLSEGTRLPRSFEALRVAALGEIPSLAAYLELDDYALLDAMATWEEASDPVLRDLCRRLRARSLFKTLELGTEVDQGMPEVIAIAGEAARAAGLDPRYYVAEDCASDTPFPATSALSVIFPDGRKKALQDVSFVLGRLHGQTLSRRRVVFAPELRQAIRGALRG